MTQDTKRHIASAALIVGFFVLGYLLDKPKDATWLEPAERDALDGVCVNLGRGGMQVRADAAPEVGAAISCKVSFAGEWTTLPGRVRWDGGPAPLVRPGPQVAYVAEARESGEPLPGPSPRYTMAQFSR